MQCIDHFYHPPPIHLKSKPLDQPFWKKKILKILLARVPTYTYVCVPCVYLVPAEVKTLHPLEQELYTVIIHCIYVLGLVPGALCQNRKCFNHEVISPAPLWLPFHRTVPGSPGRAGDVPRK